MLRKRWPMLAGLIAAGAVVGAAGALVVRRRRQRWEEYDTERVLEAMADRSAYPEPEFERATGMVSDDERDRGAVATEPVPDEERAAEPVMSQAGGPSPNSRG